MMKRVEVFGLRRPHQGLEALWVTVVRPRPIQFSVGLDGTQEEL